MRELFIMATLYSISVFGDQHNFNKLGAGFHVCQLVASSSINYFGGFEFNFR